MLEKATDVLYPPGRTRPDDAARKVLERLIQKEMLVAEAEARLLEHDWSVQSRISRKEQTLLVDELYRRGILDETGDVTDDEVRFYFERFKVGEQRRVRRILVANPDQLRRVRMRIDAGEAFDTLARELSDDPQTASKGGDMGWISRIFSLQPRVVRMIFRAEIDQLVGPVDEDLGYSWYTVADVRQVPLATVAAEVEQAARQEKRKLTTLGFLEQLANRAQVRDRPEVLEWLFERLTRAGRELPQLAVEERGRILLSTVDRDWAVGQFVTALGDEAENSEISLATVEDLRLYARRLFARAVLLPERALDLGLREADRVRDGVARERREALVERLHQLEVSEKIAPTAEQVRKYYEQHLADFTIKARLTIQELLADTRSRADSLVRALEEGADFDRLANRHSMRSPRIRRKGGRVELIGPGQYDYVGAAAQEAQVGEIVGPVKTMQGYSVFKVLRRIPGRQKSFEAAKIQAKWRLMEKLEAARFEEVLGELNRKYADQVAVYDDHVRAYLSRTE